MDHAIAPLERAAEPLSFRRAGLPDAGVVHGIYSSTPDYFEEVLSFAVPSLGDCVTEISLALTDPSREVTIVEHRGEAVGVLDVKLGYPGERDATVSQLLIAGPQQGRGFGSAAMRWLEDALKGRCDRVLAGVFVTNSGAARFYEKLGYRFSHAALPTMNWYAKSLGEGPAAAPSGSGRIEPAER